MKNKYIHRSRITEAKFREIIRLFSLDLSAQQTALISQISRNTINVIFLSLRKRIAQICEKESIFSSGEIEVDESYFGPRRVRGVPGRGAGEKTVVFGLKKRNGKVYTQIVKKASKKEILPIIEKNVKKESTIYSDGWRIYDGLVNMGYKKHYRVYHGVGEFVRGKAHINGIESFWGTAKTRLTKVRGIKKKMFYLHLKECEFRFNYRDKNLYQVLLRELRNKPLSLS